MRVYIKENKFIYEGDMEFDDCLLIDSKGRIFREELNKIKVLDDNTIKVGEEICEIEGLVVKTMNEVSREYIEAESVYLKSVEDCLPNPDDFPPGYRCVIKAMKMAKPRPLSQTQHNRKLAAIRELEKIAKGVKTTMSIAKLEELLDYYDLTFAMLMKDEYQ
ncbi:MAG: hypothetical protein ACRCX2_39170 [Paraclostridium sp.]